MRETTAQFFARMSTHKTDASPTRTRGIPPQRRILTAEDEDEFGPPQQLKSNTVDKDSRLHALELLACLTEELITQKDEIGGLELALKEVLHPDDGCEKALKEDKQPICSGLCAALLQITETIRNNNSRVRALQNRVTL